MSDPERIYLEPGEGDPMYGRQWCSDNVWAEDEAYDNDEPATGYVRVDLYARVEAENARLREEKTRAWTEGRAVGIAEMRLEFQRDPDLRRRAEEAVDYLSKKMAGRQPSGYNTTTITTLDAKLLFDLIRELAGLEEKNV